MGSYGVIRPPMNSGPSDSTLKHLKGMLPSLISGEVDDSKHINSRLCCVCGSSHYHKQVIIDPRSKLETLADSHTCKTCQSYLDSGDVAVVSADNRYAFVSATELLADHSGERLTVSTEVMDRIKEKYDNLA